MSDDMQVNLRLPISLKDRIHTAAKENNRSLNAELNERLVNSFITAQDNYSTAVNTILDLADRFRQTDRVADIKQRLDFLLDEIANTPASPYLNPALIASKLGYEYATETENWFKGKTEPSFSQLKQLAQFFGCNENWLQFGIGTPFQTSRYASFRDIVGIVDFCTAPETGYDKVHEVLFIRNNTAAGEILIVKVFDDYRAQVYQTPVHLSEVVGATGTQYRAVLVLALEAFFRSKWKLNVKSYLVQSSLYDTLISGQHNALNALGRYPFSNWMDDIWDNSMYQKQDKDEYWQGWQAVCIATNDSIVADKKLSQDKDALANHSHEAITLLNDRFYHYFD